MSKWYVVAKISGRGSEAYDASGAMIVDETENIDCAGFKRWTPKEVTASFDDNDQVPEAMARLFELGAEEVVEVEWGPGRESDFYVKGDPNMPTLLEWAKEVLHGEHKLYRAEPYHFLDDRKRVIKEMVEDARRQGHAALAKELEELLEDE